MRGDFVIETDASNVAIGGVLSQNQGNGLQPIAYYSKKLTGAPAIMQLMSENSWPSLLQSRSGEPKLMASAHALLLTMLHSLHCIPSPTSHPAKSIGYSFWELSVLSLNTSPG